MNDDEADKLRKENEELKEKLKKIQKELDEANKKLEFYESPLLSSSKRIIKEKDEETAEKIPKKRGAPEGHIGATRKTPAPDEVVDLKPEKCACGCEEVEILKTHEKTVEDIEITKTVKKYRFYECRCKNCGKKFTTSDAGLPKEGNFGPNILSLWQILHYVGTIPFGRLSAISGKCLETKISQAGVHNVIYRTAKIFKPNFKRIEKRVKKTNYAKSDETSYPVNGEKWWLWNISTTKDDLVWLRKSRGSKVLKELFGEFLNGILSSDCFSAYSKFKAREYAKCWAHVLIAAKDLAKHSAEGKQLRKMLLQMYTHIVKVKKEKQENTPKVKKWAGRAKNKINSWLDMNWETKAAKNLVLRMVKYGDDWFTCVKYPFVEPTNNSSERDIRKNVIARKISGLHRSETGLRSREIMMSTILTSEKRGNDTFGFIRNAIEKYNSGTGPPSPC